MSMINGLRTVNAMVAGALSAATLQTYLTSGSNAGSLQQALNAKTQARLIASSASAITAIMGSPAAMAIMQQSQSMVAAIIASPVALPMVKAVRAACLTLGQAAISNQAFEPAFQWTPRALPAAAITTQVAYNGTTLYLALTSTAGAYYTSPDLANWTRRSFPGAAAGTVYANIIWNGAQWLALPSAITATSPIARSTDGINWTVTPFGAGALTVSGIAWGAGKYVMLSGSTAYYTSPDGVTWTAGAFGVNMTHIAYGAGLFVITYNASSGSVMTSPDGSTWTNVTAGFAVASYNIAWNGTLFLAWNNVTTYTSTNGTAWAAGLVIGGTAAAIAAVGNVFLAQVAASNTYYTSSNPTAGGSAWTARTWPAAATTGTLAAAGAAAFFTETTTAPDVMYTTPDGINWTAALTPAAVGAGATLRYGNGNWVMTYGASQPNFLVSTDAVSWTIRQAPGAVAATWVIDYCAGAGLWMAVEVGSTAYYTSPDLVNWTARTAPIALAANDFACGASLVMIATGTTLYTSTDCITWKLGALPAAANLAYSNGLFAAMPTTAATYIYTSPDGNVWTQVSGTTSAIYTGFCWNGSNALMLSGGSNQISTNGGNSWGSSVAAGPACYANGLFVTANASSVQTSPDGVTWTARYAFSMTAYTPTQFCAGGGAYVGLVGGAAYVLTNFA